MCLVRNCYLSSKVSAAEFCFVLFMDEWLIRDITLGTFCKYFTRMPRYTLGRRGSAIELVVTLYLSFSAGCGDFDAQAGSRRLPRVGRLHRESMRRAQILYCRCDWELFHRGKMTLRCKWIWWCRSDWISLVKILLGAVTRSLLPFVFYMGSLFPFWSGKKWRSSYSQWKSDLTSIPQSSFLSILS